jgi:hypothetical protein
VARAILRSVRTENHVNTAEPIIGGKVFQLYVRCGNWFCTLSRDGELLTQLSREVTF